MKTIRYKKVLLLLLLFTFSITACKDSFLETQPKRVLIAKRTQDYYFLIGNIQQRNMEVTATVALGDEMTALDNVYASVLLNGIKHQRLFEYKDKIYEEEERAAETSAMMISLYTFNKIINEVMTSTEGTEAEKKSIRSMALFGRAWINFMLINLFAKPYDETTAATDLGWPIVKDADVNANTFKRATVKEFYTFIIDDLNAAMTDIPNSLTHRYRPSKAAVEGLLGKVYVFMGKFDLALPHLNNALDGLSAASIPASLDDYNTAFGVNGRYLPIDPYYGPNYPTPESNPEILLARQASNNYGFFGEVVVGPKTLGLYTSTDQRLKFFNNSTLGGITLPPNFKLRYGPPSIQHGVLVPDLYLLRAECRARLNDLGGAKSDVEALRAKRINSLVDVAVPTAIASNQQELVKFILDERIREFAAMGHRWFDMRRLSVDPIYKNTVDYTHELYNSNGTAVLSTYPLRPERLTLKIPRYLLDPNPGVIDNL